MNQKDAQAIDHAKIVWVLVHRERNCAENYNKYHNKFIFQTAINMFANFKR